MKYFIVFSLLFASGLAKAGNKPEKLDTTTQETPGNRKTISYDSLSEEDKKIVDRGEISTARYVVGGILGTYPLGFGIGHAIQGRYMDMGYIFTIGELGSIAVFLAGIGQCADTANWRSNSASCNSTLIGLGLGALVGFKIWEIIDLWATPPELNDRYHRLKRRMGEELTFEPTLLPLADGGMLGLRITF